jgi:hypothetical protein
MDYGDIPAEVQARLAQYAADMKAYEWRRADAG